jgi:integrase
MWLTHKRDVERRAERTLNTYADAIMKWMDFCEGEHIDPIQPTLRDLEAFMTRPRRNGRVRMPATQKLDGQVLRGFFKWCHDRNLVTYNYALNLHLPTPKRKVPRPWEDEHWVRFWGWDLPPRLRAMYGLAYFAGLRRAELYSLTSEQITETRIRAFTRKGGGEDTTYWHHMAEVVHNELPWLLPDVGTLASALAYAKNHHDRLIGWSDINQLGKRLTDLCESIGIPHYSPHQMRDSCATNLFRTPLAQRPHLIMMLMNHSSLDQTMAYARAGGTELREFLNRSKPNA